VKAGWQTKRLTDVTQVRPPVGEARARLAGDTLVSFVPMEDLGIDQKLLTPRQTKPLEEVAGSYTYFADGDVLLAKITPCFENGKLGIASGLNNGVGFGSSEFVVLRPRSGLDPAWLYYYLSREAFRVEGAGRMAGAVGHRRVAKDFIEHYPIPLPPLENQERIVAVLDEAFEAIATARANTEKNLSNARELFESHLDAVFAERGEGWGEAPLGDLCEILDARRIPITKRDRVAGEVPYYGATGVQDHVRGFLFDEPLVLVGEDGAKWGAGERSAFAVSGRCWVNNHAHVLRPNRDAVLDSWLIYYLNRSDLTKFVSGLTVPKLNQGNLREIPIPLPPLSVQSELTNAAQEAELGTERLQAIYQQKLAELEMLKQSLLHQAFAGSL